MGTVVQEWIKWKGIVHEVTTAYSPESNGNKERLNPTLMNIARTMELYIPDVPKAL